LSILQVNSCSIDQESGEIWTVQTDLQQIYSKSDSLLDDLHCILIVLLIIYGRNDGTYDNCMPDLR